MRGYPSSMAWGNLDKEALPDVNFQPHGYLFLATKVMINYDYECKKLPCQVQNFWLISDLIVTIPGRRGGVGQEPGNSIRVWGFHSHVGSGICDLKLSFPQSKCKCPNQNHPCVQEKKFMTTARTGGLEANISVAEHRGWRCFPRGDPPAVLSRTQPTNEHQQPTKGSPSQQLVGLKFLN